MELGEDGFNRFAQSSLDEASHLLTGALRRLRMRRRSYYHITTPSGPWFLRIPPVTRAQKKNLLETPWVHTAESWSFLRCTMYCSGTNSSRVDMSCEPDCMSATFEEFDDSGLIRQG